MRFQCVLIVLLLGLTGPVAAQEPDALASRPAPATALDSAHARVTADLAGQEVSVMAFGADKTGGRDSLAAFNAAAASVAPGGDIRIKVPRGTYKMAAAFRGNGRNVTLDIEPGVVWTGFSPPYFGPRGETISRTTHQLGVVLNSTSANATSVDSQNVQEGGTQGPPAWYRTWTYTGNGPSGVPMQSIPDALFVRWDHLPNPTRYGLAANWTEAVFPVTGAGQGAIAEWNPMNRSGDPGWSDAFGGGNHFGGIHIVPEVDTVTGGPKYGFPISYSFATVQSSHTNITGYSPQTYNAFIAYPNSVAPNGRAFYAGGSTTGMPSRLPYAPLQATGNWQHGLSLETGTYRDNLAVRLSGSHAIGWEEGSGIATIAPVKGTAGNIGLSLMPAGTGNIKITSLAVTPSTPASASATCTVGQIAVDAGYIYVCVAANVWKRAALGAW
jgi:hypothetical protein